MKVYIVVDFYDGLEIEKVFLSREKAQAWLDSLSRHESKYMDIREYEVEDPN